MPLVSRRAGPGGALTGESHRESPLVLPPQKDDRTATSPPTFLEDPIMESYVQLSTEKVASAYLVFTWLLLALLLDPATSRQFIYSQFYAALAARATELLT